MPRNLHTQSRRPYPRFTGRQLGCPVNLKFLPFKSLKVRVTLLTVGIFVLGISTFTVYISLSLRDDMQRVFGEQQFASATVLANDINGEVIERLGVLETEATRFSRATPLNKATLQSFMLESPALQLIFNAGITIYSPDGAAIAAMPAQVGPIGQLTTDLDSVAAVIKGGKAQVGRPIKDPVLQTAVLTMTVPIRDSQGVVIGAIAGLINLGRPSFLDKISQNRYGKTGSYFLIAPKWRLIITGSDNSSRMGTLPAPGVIPWIDRAVEGYEGSAVYMASNGTQVLGSVKAVPATNWYIVARVPTAEAFAPIRAMQERRLLAAAFLSVWVVLLTWWMLRRQLTPLTQTAKVLAQWDPATPIPSTLAIARKDEIGDLVGGFNAMLQTLAQREESLHQHQIELKMQNEQLIRSEAELSEARSHYFDLYNLAPVGYCTVSEKGLILDVNLTGSSMLGLPRSKLVGMAFHRLLLKEDQSIYHRHSTVLLNSRLPQECELRLALPDGAALWVNLMSSVEQEDKGASVLRVVISDITARKSTELALHETHVELEKLVNYTKLYQNERLVALGVMAGGIAHELRNPLSVCFSAAQFLRDQPGDLAEQQQCTQKIIEGIEKSSSIIDNLLRFARQPLDDEMRPTNLVSVLHESVVTVTAQARLQRISLLEDYEEAKVPILGNAILLQQVLMNLFLNACQAMPVGGEIRTAVRRSASEAVLWVRDTGEGIAPENVSRLFDPVFTTRPEGQGNGLGLPICRLIVQRHGGSISVESVLGEGSTFTIRLPLMAGIPEHFGGRQ